MQLIKMAKIKNESGFTIVEALISLVILSMALLPALNMAGLAATISYSIQSNLTAAQLAQEGVEIARGIRDDSWFNNQAFDENLPEGNWTIQWDSDALMPLGLNPPLKIDNGLYNYYTGENTIFSREISITKVNSVELKIQSKVTWVERGRNREVAVESHLFDWK